MAIDPVGVWTPAWDEYKRRVRRKMCAWFSPFVMGITDLPPWERLAQSGRVEPSSRLYYIRVCIRACPSVFLVFLLILILYVYFIVSHALREWNLDLSSYSNIVKRNSCLGLWMKELKNMTPQLPWKPTFCKVLHWNGEWKTGHCTKRGLEILIRNDKIVSRGSFSPPHQSVFKANAGLVLKDTERFSFSSSSFLKVHRRSEKV